MSLWFAVNLAHLLDHTSIHLCNCFGASLLRTEMLSSLEWDIYYGYIKTKQNCNLNLRIMLQ